MKIAVLLLSAGALYAQNLMPLPAKMTRGQGALAVGEHFRIVFTGHKEPRLEAAAGRLTALVARKTGIPIRPAGRAALEVRCAGPGDAEEAYRLSVTPEGARIEAAEPPGVLRAFATFSQLVELGPDGFRVPAVEIDDRPRFPWRGLLLDPARHWMPVETVKRTIDGMAAVKLNILHLHLADDQGFRVESRRYPKLHEMGSDGIYYTQDQVREIVAYARDRAIQIVPEFDMPAHAQSWFVGYPELASLPGPYPLERFHGKFDPILDPTREEVYTFIDNLVREMAALFPSPYFHTGGDEVNGKQWDANPRIQEFMRARGMKDNRALQNYFSMRVSEIVRRHGKIMSACEEVLQPGLPRDTVVHAWRGPKSLAEVAATGYPTVYTHGYYLDLMYSAERHYLLDPEAEGGNIIGGEACEWTELATAENVDARIWPRMAAIAERFWSPRGVRDVDSMYRRLDAASRELEWVGMQHESSFRLMTERLAGPYDAEPVRVLAETVEPIKGYRRHSTRKYTSFTPLNRLVDVARAESLVARRFARTVDAYLADGTGADEIRRRLMEWRDNHARLAPALETALLAEAAGISEDLSALAAAALEVLDGRPAPAGTKARLERAGKPRAELLLVVAPSIGRLLDAPRKP